VIAGQITGDVIEPRGNVLLPIELVAHLPDTLEDLLHHVVQLGGRDPHPQHEPPDVF
jgi:hypothetical protein